LNNKTIKEAVTLWYNNKNEASGKYGPINTWNVSNVTDMSKLFRSSDFNDDISNWDVSNITDMSQMFENAHCFNQL
jgi:surface protein